MSTEPSYSVEKRNFKYEAEAVGTEVNTVSPGDRVAVNVETFCRECFFCKRGNRTDTNGGGLGCRIFQELLRRTGSLKARKTELSRLL